MRDQTNHPYLFCLIMGAAAVWSARKFRSGFSQGQEIVYLTGVATYTTALCAFLLKFLWQSKVIPPSLDSATDYMIARTSSMGELLSIILSEMQGFYCSFDGVTKVLVWLAAVCYALALCMYIGNSLYKGIDFRFSFFLGSMPANASVADSTLAQKYLKNKNG